MIYPLRMDDDPILLQPTRQFDFENPPFDPVELANNMLETMHHHNGLGISANQCGLPYKVFVMLDGETFRACFNPDVKSIIEAEDTVLEEGCLSYPSLFLNVKRKDAAVMHYVDEYGGGHMVTLTGLSARIALHEHDHLCGISFTKRVSKLRLQMAQKKRSKVKI